MPYVGAVTSAANLRNHLATSMGRVHGLLAVAIQRTVQLAASYAGAGLQYNHRTYRYRKSITTGVQMGSTGTGVGVVRASAPYAVFLENGTKAHWVGPKRGKALSWVQNGARRFSKGHMVRGIAPRHPMRDAQRRATPFFERVCAEAFVRAFA